jgi:uncharacterized protein (TIGR02246 family)
MKKKLLYPVLLAVPMFGAYAQTPGLSAEEAAIRRVDGDMVAALNRHNVEAWLAHFASDGRMMPPGSPPVVGKEAIRQLIEGFMCPEFRVVHHLEGVVVSKSADLAYVWYSYELTFKGPTGTVVTERGKDTSVFTKAPGGSWQVAVDMWSENQ